MGCCCVTEGGRGDASDLDAGPVKRQEGERRALLASPPMAARPRPCPVGTESPVGSDESPLAVSGRAMPVVPRRPEGRLSVRSCESMMERNPRGQPISAQWRPAPRHLDTLSGPFSPVHSSVGTTPSASPCASVRSCSPFQGQRSTYGGLSPELSYQKIAPHCPPMDHSNVPVCIVPPAARRNSSIGPGRAVPMPVSSGKWRRGSTFSDPMASSGDEGSLRLPNPPVFERSSNSRNPSPQDAEQMRLHLVKKEIYETECSYVAGLRQLCDYYLEPMKQMLDGERRRGRRGSWQGNDSPPAGPKQQADYIFDRFFGSLMLIVSCNTTLLQDMQSAIVEYQSGGAPRAGADTDEYDEPTPDLEGDFSGVDYGKVFGNFKILVLYDSYIVNYEEFQAHLREHGGIDARGNAEPSRLSALVARVQNQLEQGGSTLDLSLSGLLITPIRRLAGYRTLLERLVKLSGPEDESLPALKKACGEILSVINHINEKKREADIDLKVAEIGEELGLPSLARKGRYWRLGGTEMRKISIERGKRILGPCQVYLLSDILLWVKKQGVMHRKKAHCVQLEDILEVLDYFPGEAAMQTTSPGPVSPGVLATSAPTPDHMERFRQSCDCTFAIKTQAYTLGLVAASPAQKIVWVDAIKEEQRRLCRRSRLMKRKRTTSNIGIPLKLDSDG
eukprot:Hpha_TRINITY_DN15549_c7_g4::TRINITY_DN15549_c7_g4_i1::g.107237::m.107237